MTLDIVSTIIKLSWTLMQLHVLFIFGSYSASAFQSGNGRVDKMPSSGCPIMRTKAFIGRQTARFSNSMALPACNFACASPFNLVEDLARNPSQALLYLSSRDVYLRKHAENYLQPIGHRANLRLMSSVGIDETNGELFFTPAPTAPAPVLQASTLVSPAFPSSSTRKYQAAAADLELVVLGLSHHNAAVDVREKLAVPEAEWNAVASALCELPSISEASVLSTCNRFELFLSGPNQYECIRDALAFLEARCGGSLDKDTLRKSLFMLSGEDAIWHVLRVAGGLDSLVVGEGQILAQVKKSHEHGVEGECPAGKVVAKLLNTAVTAGKRVRAETGIAKGAVSISSAAAQFTALKVAQDCRIDKLEDANLAIIGTGKMARLLLVHLQSQGVKTVTIVNRSPNRIDELRAEFPDMDIKFELMDKLWDVIANSDVVFPSTSSNSTIIDPIPLSAAMARRHRPGGIQFVDISVPRNVHPDCSSIPGVFNYNVDFLKAAVDRNTALRKREILEAETLLKEELFKFQLWQQSLGAIPTISKLQEKAEIVRQEEIQKMSKTLLANMSSAEVAAVEKLSKGIVAKLLHGPLLHLRSQREGESSTTAIKHLRMAFQLEH